MNSKQITVFLMKRKTYILLFWIAFGTFMSITYAPGLLEQTRSELKAPTNSESAQAEKLLRQYFPDEVDKGEHIVLFNNPNEAIPISELLQVSSEIIQYVLSEYPDAEIMGYAVVAGTPLDSIKDEFISKDGKSSIMTISINGGQKEQREFVHELRNVIKKADSTLLVYVLGEIALDLDTDESIERDLSTIDAIVIPIVFLALIILLRNWKYLPITMFPIGLSIGISFALLERYIAFTGNIILAFVPSVLISLTLGIGVDYNLFLLSRFQEERKAGKSVKESVEIMMQRAGHTIFTSGVTLILTMAGLVFFPVSVLSSVGVGISIAITVLLIINLSFTPTLLLAFGSWIEKEKKGETKPLGSKFWYKVGKLSTRHSILVIATILLLSAPIVVNMVDFTPQAQTVFFSPAGSESREGMQILQDSFGQGVIGPLSAVVVPISGSVWTAEVFQATHRAVQRMINELSIDSRNILSHAWLNGSAISTDFALAAFDNGSMIYNTQEATLYRVYAQSFVSKNAEAMLMSITLNEDVWSQEAGKKANAIRNILQEEFNGEIGIYGIATNSADVIKSTFDYFPFVILGIIIVIYIFIALMFGAAILPLRLITTIALTLTFIFGATTVVFQKETILNEIFPRLNDVEVTFWMVPVMSFSIILGLGIDYDVFTLERIRENLSYGMDNAEAIATGISKTSRIITSAGIIMMIAFGGLMFSSSYILMQFGFVLTVSVFLDTFLVRSVLVPAIMSIGEKWNWWPSVPHAENE